MKKVEKKNNDSSTPLEKLIPFGNFHSARFANLVTFCNLCFVGYLFSRRRTGKFVIAFRRLEKIV
jgi:hypothetical protein